MTIFVVLLSNIMHTHILVSCTCTVNLSRTLLPLAGLLLSVDMGHLYLQSSVCPVCVCISIMIFDLPVLGISVV